MADGYTCIFCPQIAPLILPVLPDGTAYEGFLSPSVSDRLSSCPAICRHQHSLKCLQSEEGDAAATLWLRLSQLPPPSAAGRAGATLRGARLEVNAPLAELLQGQGELVAARLEESRSLSAFLVELRSMLDAVRLQRWVPGMGTLCCKTDGAGQAGAGMPIALPHRLTLILPTTGAALRRQQRLSLRAAQRPSSTCSTLSLGRWAGGG